MVRFPSDGVASMAVEGLKELAICCLVLYQFEFEMASSCNPSTAMLAAPEDLYITTGNMHIHRLPYPFRLHTVIDH